jgi:hypothetical protein
MRWGGMRWEEEAAAHLTTHTRKNADAFGVVLRRTRAADIEHTPAGGESAGWIREAQG